VTKTWSLSAKVDGLTDGIINTEVAFDVCQVSVTDCPATTLLALAANVTMGAAAFTVIVTDCVTVPPAPVTVIVYVVVAVGVTVMEPLIGSADVLTDGEKLTAVAFDVCHCNETCCPAVIVIAFADNVAVGAGSELDPLESFELPQEDKPETTRIRHSRETGRRIFAIGRSFQQLSIAGHRIQLLCWELLMTCVMNELGVIVFAP
jgi:hypothetical protein